MRWIVCVVLLLLGCASSGLVVDVSGLSLAEDLDQQALRSGGLAVLGFVGELPDMPESPAKLSGELAYVLELWLPGVPVKKPSTLRGPALDEARERLSVGSLSLPFDALRSETGVRYLVSAELRSNEVIHTDSESDDETTYVTTRAVRVRYRILDLEQKRVAFQGIVSKRGERENTHQHDHDGTLGSALAGALVNMMSGTYPEAPEAVWIVRKASADFASLLPGALPPDDERERQVRARARQSKSNRAKLPDNRQASPSRS